MSRILYFGSSDFSLPGLQACLDAPGFEVVGVITTPPQRQGRGLELTPTVVAQFCTEKKIPFFEHQKLDEMAMAETAQLRPEIFVVASYGKIIPESFLKLAQLRFNIHPSLLPKYRGASPLSGPILAGDSVTGLSIADVTKDLDAGDIYFQEEMALHPKMDSENLGKILAQKSYAVIRTLLENSKAEKNPKTPQNHALSSYAPKLKKEDGRLSFNDPAEKWDRIVRGLKPWPGAFTEILNERVSIESVVHRKNNSTMPLGTICEITNNSLIVQTAKDCIEFLQVKPAGKKTMTGADYARGRRWQVGTHLIQ